MPLNYANCNDLQCQQYSLVILEHAQQKWESAVKLAADGDYGSAIALHIISTEEIIKSLVLAFDSTGFKLRKVKGMDALFNHHGLRHVLSYFVYAMGSVMDDLLKFLDQFKSCPESLLDIVKDLPAHHKKVEYYVLRKTVQFKQDLTWFASMDNMRQNGFYSGFWGTFSTPKAISKEAYDHQLLRLSLVRWFGEQIIKLICEDPETKESLKAVIPKTEESKLYNGIANAIQIVKQTRKPPIELLKENFDNFR